MSTDVAPTRREPVLATIVLFPFRAVERTRGWRRLALLALYGLTALGIWALLLRQSQLARLPDVGDTFGVAALGESGQVSDDRNAFVLYRQAVERYREMNDAEGNAFNNADLQWSRANATLRHWVADNEQSITLMCLGTLRPDAFLGTPDHTADPLAPPEKVEVIRRLSWVADAALFKAGRLRSEGDRTGAWTLLKAVVRVSRDMERAVPSTSTRQTAMTLVQYAQGPVTGWAGDPAVTPALLRQALDDLGALEALTPPISHFYRYEYQSAEDSFMRLSLSTVLHDQRVLGILPSRRFDLLPDLEVYLRGEPERSRRVLRLLAANDLAWCDRPVAERPAFAIPRLRIYDHDPAAPAAARALLPDDLARSTDSSLISPALKWRLGDLEEWERNDRWSLSLLRSAVAAALLSRDPEQPQATPHALRRYLPVPGDTPKRDEAEPLPAPEQSGKQSPR
jgi:hypothetical protein